ncbi:Glu/Leu/Phe/Val dehydrogenase [Porticoccus sp. W117]|uniref:Glu/Leu/Phe/Val family dehydrogenase n=1 Tax=Porticoccus sp. W117 TaxID=3054777 RepID=UPI002596E6FE|nr:Glu/Leu/Phe/Val dehydrogenase [Porticoccus sp. W117]MDM3870431.1 Glu/Leu/Phe/Val dehydrogenase [Porticoccus sp. W117]
MDVFKDAVSRLNRLGMEAGIDLEVLQTLNYPEQTVTAALPVRMDNGRTEIFVGHRCRFNSALGPTKGGIRYHPGVTVEEVQALALWMTIKCSLANIPYGGGKGGVTVDPKSLSPMELERLSRSYMRAMVDVVGPCRDIPAPDVYTNARIMGWMADEYERIKRQKEPGVITGKPIELGGSLGRDEATGRGAYLVTRQLAQKLNWNPGDIRVALQGFGNAGYHVARLLHADGYRIVAVSDSQGAIYSEKGFDVESLYKYKQEQRKLEAVYCEGSVCSLQEHQRISNEELLELDVDLLIPAALEGVINESNASRIKAPVIVEVANGPIDSGADALLEQQGIQVLPDVLANAGGVVVSYFEWVQNRQGWAWGLEQVRERLQETLAEAFDNMWQVHKDEGVPLRNAAYAVALRRISKAISSHGTQEYFQNGEG